MQVFSCGCGFVRPFLLAAASLSRLHCRPFVEARVERVEIPAVKPVLKSAERFTETLEMDDFPFPQEADRVADVGIFYDTQDVVVCRAGFLLGRQILKQIRDGIPLRLELVCVKGNAARRLRPDSYRMVNIIVTEALGIQLLGG